jgi:hypothetical protein
MQRIYTTLCRILYKPRNVHYNPLCLVVVNICSLLWFVLSCVLTGLVTSQYLMSTTRPEKCGKRGDRIDLQHHSVLFKWKLKKGVDCDWNPVARTYSFNPLNAALNPMC